MSCSILSYGKAVFHCVVINIMPVPVAARSKAWFYDLSPAEIVGSNPTGGMDVCGECCVLSKVSAKSWSLAQSSPTDCCVLMCVLSGKKPFVNEDESQDPIRGCRAKKKKFIYIIQLLRNTLRSQTELESAHYQETETNWFKSKINQLANREKIQPVYRRQTTSLQSGDQTHLDLRNRTLGMCQQIKHSNHAESTIKNPQNHNKCSLVCDKSYPP